jgi:predicted DNA binding CopG/RHH family protein
MNTNPDSAILDEEEQWYEDHADEFVPAPADLRKSIIQAAKTSANKTERMNIRMSKADMDSLKLAAAREGLPYQSLVASILHKYTAGVLVDINEARKIVKA